jgi:hypothetical protein
MLIIIDFISSSLGTIHSKMMSIKSMFSSSTINAGVFVIFNLSFNSLFSLFSNSIKSQSQSSSKAKVTLLFNSSAWVSFP